MEKRQADMEGRKNSTSKLPKSSLGKRGKRPSYSMNDSKLEPISENSSSQFHSTIMDSILDDTLKPGNESVCEASFKINRPTKPHKFSLPNQGCGDSFTDSLLLFDSEPVKSVALQTTGLDVNKTPPHVLRKFLQSKIKACVDLESALQELSEFTTYERQVLATEGMKELQSENESLKKRLEEITKTTDSLKLELCKLSAENVALKKDVSEAKSKAVELECVNDVNLNRWKLREEELKKSLEESWNIISKSKGGAGKLMSSALLEISSCNIKNDIENTSPQDTSSVQNKNVDILKESEKSATILGLEERINDLLLQIEEKNTAMLSLQNDNLKVIELKEKVAYFESLEQSWKAQGEKVLVLENKIVELSDQLLSYSSDASLKNQELMEQALEISKKRETILSLEVDLNNKIQLISELEKKVTALESSSSGSLSLLKLNEYEKMIEELKRRVNVCMETITSKDLELVSNSQLLQSKIDELSSNNQSFEAMIKDKDALIGDLSDKISLLEKSNSQYLLIKDLIVVKENEIKDLKEEICKSTDQITSKNEEISKINNDYKEKLIKSDIEISTLKSKIHENQLLIDQVEKQSEAIQNEKESSIESLKKQISILESKVEEMSVEIVNKNEEISNLKLENLHKCTSLERLEKDLEERGILIEDLQIKLSELEIWRNMEAERSKAMNKLESAVAQLENEKADILLKFKDIGALFSSTNSDNLDSLVSLGNLLDEKNSKIKHLEGTLCHFKSNLIQKKEREGLLLTSINDAVSVLIKTVEDFNDSDPKSEVFTNDLDDFHANLKKVISFVSNLFTQNLEQENFFDSRIHLFAKNICNVIILMCSKFEKIVEKVKNNISWNWESNANINLISCINSVQNINSSIHVFENLFNENINVLNDKLINLEAKSSEISSNHCEEVLHSQNAVISLKKEIVEKETIFESFVSLSRTEQSSLLNTIDDMRKHVNFLMQELSQKDEALQFVKMELQKTSDIMNNFPNVIDKLKDFYENKIASSRSLIESKDNEIEALKRINMQLNESALSSFKDLETLNADNISFMNELNCICEVENSDLTLSGSIAMVRSVIKSHSELEDHLRNVIESKNDLISFLKNVISDGNDIEEHLRNVIQSKEERINNIVTCFKNTERSFDWKGLHQKIALMACDLNEKEIIPFNSDLFKVVSFTENVDKHLLLNEFLSFTELVVGNIKSLVLEKNDFLEKIKQYVHESVDDINDFNGVQNFIKNHTSCHVLEEHLRNLLQSKCEQVQMYQGFLRENNSPINNSEAFECSNNSSFYTVNESTILDLEDFDLESEEKTETNKRMSLSKEINLISCKMDELKTEKELFLEKASFIVSPEKSSFTFDDVLNALESLTSRRELEEHLRNVIRSKEDKIEALVSDFKKKEHLLLQEKENMQHSVLELEGSNISLLAELEEVRISIANKFESIENLVKRVSHLEEQNSASDNKLSVSNGVDSFNVDIETFMDNVLKIESLFTRADKADVIHLKDLLPVLKETLGLNKTLEEHLRNSIESKDDRFRALQRESSSQYKAVCEEKANLIYRVANLEEKLSKYSLLLNNKSTLDDSGKVIEEYKQTILEMEQSIHLKNEELTTLKASVEEVNSNFEELKAEKMYFLNNIIKLNKVCEECAVFDNLYDIMEVLNKVLGSYECMEEHLRNSIKSNSDRFDALLAVSKDKCSSLKEENKKLVGLISDLEGENASILGACKSKDTEFNELKVEVKKLEGEVRMKTKKLESVENELSVVSSNLQASESEKKLFFETINKSHWLVTEQEKLNDNTPLMNVYSSLDLMFTFKHELEEHLRNVIKSKDEIIEVSRLRILDLETLLSTLKKELGEEVSNFEILSDRIDGIVKENDSYSNSLNELFECAGVQGENSKVTAVISKFKEHTELIEHLRNVIQSKDDQLAVLKADIESVKLEALTLQEEMASTIKDQGDQLLEKNNEIQYLNEMCNVNLTHCQQSLSDLLLKVESVEKNSESLNELRSCISSLTSHVENLNSELTFYKNTVENNEAMIKDKTECIQTLLSKVSVLESELARKVSEEESLATKNETLELELLKGESLNNQYCEIIDWLKDNLIESCSSFRKIVENVLTNATENFGYVDVSEDVIGMLPDFVETVNLLNKDLSSIIDSYSGLSSTIKSWSCDGNLISEISNSFVELNSLPSIDCSSFYKDHTDVIIDLCNIPHKLNELMANHMIELQAYFSTFLTEFHSLNDIFSALEGCKNGTINDILCMEELWSYYANETSLLTSCLKSLSAQKVDNSIIINNDNLPSFSCKEIYDILDLISNENDELKKILYSLQSITCKSPSTNDSLPFYGDVNDSLNKTNVSFDSCSFQCDETLAPEVEHSIFIPCQLENTTMSAPAVDPFKSIICSNINESLEWGESVQDESNSETLDETAGEFHDAIEEDSPGQTLFPGTFSQKRSESESVVNELRALVSTAVISAEPNQEIDLVEYFAELIQDIKEAKEYACKLLGQDVSKSSVISVMYSAAKIIDKLNEDLNSKNVLNQNYLQCLKTSREHISSLNSAKVSLYNDFKILHSDSSNSFGLLKNRIQTLLESCEVQESENTALKFNIKMLESELLGLLETMKDDIKTLKNFGESHGQSAELYGKVQSIYSNKMGHIRLLGELDFKDFPSSVPCLLESWTGLISFTTSLLDILVCVQANNDELTGQNNLLLSEVDILKQNLKEKDQNIMTMINENEEITSNYNHYKRKYEEENNLADSLKNKYDSLEINFNDLSNKYEAAIKELTSYKCDICTQIVSKISILFNSLGNPFSFTDLNSAFSIISNKIQLLKDVEEQNSKLSIEKNVMETLIESLQSQLKDHEVQVQKNTSLDSKYQLLQRNYDDLLVHYNEMLCEIKIKNTGKVEVDSNKVIEEVKHILRILECNDDVDFAEGFDLVFSKIRSRIELMQEIVDQSRSAIKNTSYSELDKKIKDLEMELEESNAFKLSFANELVSLDPNLNVSELKTQSLFELNAAMLSAIMEKEKIIISDMKEEYDKKLFSCTEKIEQSENEAKRIKEWASEVEKDNDSLNSKCENLKEEMEALYQKFKGKNNCDQMILQELNCLERKLIQQSKDNLNSSNDTYVSQEPISLDSASVDDFKLFDSSYEIYEKIQKMRKHIVYNDDPSLRYFSENDDTIKKLVEKCQSLEAQLSVECTSKKDEMMKEKLQLEEDYETTLENLKSLDEKLKASNSKYLALLEENAELKLSLENSLDRCKKLEEESQIKIDGMSKTIGLLTSDLSKERDALEKRNIQFQEILQQNEFINAQLKSHFKDLEEMKLELTLAKSSVSDERKKHEAEISSLMSVISSLESELKTARSSISGLRDSEKKCVALEADISKVREELGSLKIEYSLSLNSLEVENKKLKEEINLKEREFGVLKEKLESEVSRLKSQLNANIGVCEVLKSSSDNYVSQVRALEIKLSEKEKEHVKETEQLKKLVHIYNEKLKSLENFKSQYNSKLILLENKLEEREDIRVKERKCLENNISEHLEKIKLLENTIEKLNLTICTLKTKLSEKDKEFMTDKVKLESLAGKYFEEIKELRMKLVQNKSDIAKYDNVLLQKVLDYFPGSKEIDDNMLKSILERLDDYSTLKEDLAEKSEKCDELDEECEFLNSKNTYLNNELQKACRETQQLKEKHGVELTNLTLKMKEMTERKDALEAEVEKLKNISKEQASKIFVLNETINRLNTELNETELRRASLDRELKGKQSEVSRCLNCDDSTEKIKHLEYRLKLKETKIEEMAVKLNNLDSQTKEKTDCLQEYRERLSTVLEENQRLKTADKDPARHQSFGSVLKAHNQDTVLQQAQKISSLEQKIKKLEKDRETLKKLCSLRHEKIEELKRRLPETS